MKEKELEITEKEQLKKDILQFKAGDTIKVHYRVKEGEKERIQIFEGTVIAIRGREMSKSIVVRKVSAGIGVERIFPINSPLIKKIEVKMIGKVRRSKLYYLRELSGKAAKIKEWKR